ncbi:response regulator transcription factor [Sphingopyxis sp. CCNWLW253]|uniref:response regulator transcription factor n=1 Tax=unclassified Sphingopyxis TaxID=2614943 RepID=UPI003012A3A5
MNQGLPLNPDPENASPALAGPPDRPLVLIVDDDAAVRTAIEELLFSVGIDTAGFGSTRELLEAELPDRPGCLVLDVRMPGSSGLDLQQHFAATGNAKPIVFLTGHGDIAMTVQAMKAGAVDFLTKPVRDQSLLDAVTAGIERDIVLRADAHNVRRQMDRYVNLTAREREVLRHLARGRLNKQIAYDLGISEVTVKLHRGSIRRKMAVNTVGELIRAWDVLPADLRDAGS